MIPTRSLCALAACAALAACSSAPSRPGYAYNDAYTTRMLPSDVTVLSTSPALIETTPMIVARRTAKPSETSGTR